MKLGEPTSTPASPYLSAKEAASYLRLKSAAAVLKLVTEGRLRPSARVDDLHPLFTRAGLDAFATGAPMVAPTIAATTAGPAPRMRLREYAPRWLDARKPNLASYTAEHYHRTLERINAELGDRFLDELTPIDVKEWLAQCLADKARASGTVHGWFRVLRTMINDARADLSLTNDPMFRVRGPRVVPVVQKFPFTPQELRRFLDAVKVHAEPHYALIFTLAWTGLRFSVISALQWPDIDFPAGIIYFRRKQVRGVVEPINSIKWAPEYAVMPKDLADALLAHRRLLERGATKLRADGPLTQEQLESVYRRLTAGDSASGIARELGVTERRIRELWETRKRLHESGWCFPSAQGTLREPSSIRKSWWLCLKQAGITKNVTIHSLRRTMNDDLRKSGVDPVTIRAMIGHSAEGMRAHYSTVDVDERREAMEKVMLMRALPLATNESRVSSPSPVEGSPK
jgi:integrase